MLLRFALALTAAVSLYAQGAGQLSVKAHPGRAGVFVDGKYLGPAANFRVARTYSVPAGQHELKLVDPRYEEFVTKVDIQPGKKTKISQSLKPLPVPSGPFGKVRVQNPDKFAAVYVNDKYFGHVDEFSNSSQGILLPPGEYEFRIEPASGAPISTKARVEANKTVVVK